MNNLTRFLLRVKCRPEGVKSKFLQLKKERTRGNGKHHHKKVLALVTKVHAIELPDSLKYDKQNISLLQFITFI